MENNSLPGKLAICTITSEHKLINSVFPKFSVLCSLTYYLTHSLTLIKKLQELNSQLCICTGLDSAN